VANLIGQCNTWDAAHGIAQVPLMDAAQLQAWVDGGQEVGSHTLSHANLASLSEAQQVQEIAESKTALEKIVRQARGVQHFCYPYGAYTPDTVRVVRQSGYRTATTTARARVQWATDTALLELPRVLVSRTTTWVHLLLKCFTGYEDRQARVATIDQGDLP
jgi:peptidoglycan/xylan/chitin deacetylase (PgdA/CDA1 family)